MNNKNPVVIISVMALYMIFMVVIGIYYARKNRSSSDYFLGGRKLGPWVTAMSAEASDMSSWLLMGLPGLAYASGLASATWTAVGLIIGTYLNWKIVAAPLRKYTHVANDSITLPDFFSNRFHDKKKILMTVSALLFLVFFTVYTASGFAACGKLFNSLFGYDYTACMIVCAVIIVLYTSLGGFLAASTTDFFQGLLMSASLVVILIGGVVSVGGIGEVINNVKELPGYFSLLTSYDPATGQAASYGAVAIISGLVWGLGYFGVPHVLLRFMAIRSSSEIKKSRRIATTWCFISLVAAVAIGVVGHALYPDLLTGTATETIFIVLTTTILPAVFAGLVLSGILAATMSTADSQLLVTASAISENLFKGVLKKEASEKHKMLISRITVIAVAIVACLIALDQNSSVFGLVSNAWAGFGASFGPLILFSLFWKRTTLKGAIAGMIGGVATVFIWLYLIKPLGGWFGLYELGPAFLVSCLLIYIVSKLDKEPSKEILEEFEAAKKSTI